MGCYYVVWNPRYGGLQVLDHGDTVETGDDILACLTKDEWSEFQSFHLENYGALNAATSKRTFERRLLGWVKGHKIPAISAIKAKADKVIRTITKR